VDIIKNKMIPHNKPTIGKEEAAAAKRVLDSGWLSEGSEVLSFENEFCKYLGLPKGHAVAVSNGTSALYLALWSLDANNKNIAFPGYACSALQNAVSLIGGHEKIIDVKKNSPNIDLEMVTKENSDLVIVPHMYGIPTELTNIHNLNIIEDCAQSLGAEINNKKVGLHGTVGIFSFYATKLITSGGQGGMFVSNNK
jgi:perosamine synthetase